jgi:hypothetical protein
MKYREFKEWLVANSIDMLMSQHQLTWNDVYCGLYKLKGLRRNNSLQSVCFPKGFNPASIKGHTFVDKK